MIIDTNNFDPEITITRDNGLAIINPREIGIEIAYQLFDQEVIYESDFYNMFYEYLEDETSEVIDTIWEVLESNGHDDRISLCRPNDVIL